MLKQEQQYDTEEINELADQIDLLDYVSEEYEWQKRSGNNYFFSCPLHSDSDPSLAIDIDRNYYYCFACHRSGNALSWMIDYEGLSYPEACEKVQIVTGKTLQPISTSESMRFYRKMRKIKSGSRTDNLQSREYQSLAEYNKYSGNLPQLWLAEGISTNAMHHFNVRTDPTRNRILYPIYDQNGKFICAKGRTTLSDYKLLGIPKYKYLGKIGINDFFVGWKENQGCILETEKVILFEGIKSVMKAWDWGYKNCLACETSALNDEQVKFLIKNRVKDVTIAFDSDKTMNDIAKCSQTLKRFTNLYSTCCLNKLLGEKESPVDEGREIFEQMLEGRVRL